MLRRHDTRRAIAAEQLLHARAPGHVSAAHASAVRGSNVLALVVLEPVSSLVAVGAPLAALRVQPITLRVAVATTGTPPAAGRWGLPVRSGLSLNLHDRRPALAVRLDVAEEVFVTGAARFAGAGRRTTGSKREQQNQAHPARLPRD